MAFCNPVLLSLRATMLPLSCFNLSFSSVLYAQCCHVSLGVATCLWDVHSWLPPRFSITFINHLFLRGLLLSGMLIIKVEQELLPFRSTWVHPQFLVGSCYSIFSFMCMFCRSLCVLLSFFLWPLCCLSFFDIQILISPPVFSRVHVTRSLVFCVMFCRSLFVLLFFFFWPLCCLSFFKLQILITPLVSSNSSFNKK